MITEPEEGAREDEVKGTRALPTCCAGDHLLALSFRPFLGGS